VIGIGLVIGIWPLGFVVGGCGQGQGISSGEGCSEESYGETYGALKVSPESVTLSIGDTQQFVISGLVKTSSASTVEVTWRVFGGVGTIDATGFFRATDAGQGTVEARVGSLEGRASVVVASSTGKVIRGKVKNIFASGEGISSAVVMAGGKVTTSLADGSYILSDVPISAETVSAAAPGFFPMSVSLSGETTDIPMGSWFQAPYSFPSENTEIRGRVVDRFGNPVTSSTPEVWFEAVFEEGGGFGGSSFLGTNGIFSDSISVPKNRSSVQGCIFAGYKDGDIYRAVVKEVTLVRGVTLEVGDIVVQDPAATITGTVSSPSGFSTYFVEWGVMFSQSERSSVSSSWRSNNYTFHVPAPPTGKKFYVEVLATKGNDYMYYYLNDISVISGEVLTQNIVLPSGIEVVYPAIAQTGVSVTPKFEWTSAGEGFTYVVIVGDPKSWIKWWGLTMGTSLEYPSFPIGKGGEIANLKEGSEYYMAIAGYKGLNIYGLTNVSEFSEVDAVVYHSTVPFTVGTPSASSVRAFSMRGKEEFDKRVKEFLRGLGIPEH